MSTTIIDASHLTGVPQSLLLTLHFRALDSRQAAPVLGDSKAEEILGRLRFDRAILKGHAHDRVIIMMRAREFDRRARTFLAEHPDATVIELGCGLDTRFYRIDNGRLSWYDLDLPEVIQVRRQVLSESSRCRFLAGSVLDFSWMDRVAPCDGSAVLLMAEGVLMYLEDGEARALVRALRRRFPGGRLIADVFSRSFVRLSPWVHPALTRMRMAPRSGIDRSEEIEAWDEGLRVIDEWTYFDQPEPRLGAMRLLRFVPPFAQGARILSLQLGP